MEEYFTIEFYKGNGAILLNLVNTGSDGEMNSIRYYYWKNTIPNAARDNYTGTIVGGTGQVADGSRINCNQGDIIRLYRPEQTAIGNGLNNVNRFNGMSNCKVYGNLASLIGYTDVLPEKAFTIMFYYCMFTDCSGLYFPWTNVPKWAYRWMFYGCNQITKIPNISTAGPVTLGQEACHQMFRQCNALTKVDLDEWKITSAGNGAFQNLFFSCTGLNYVKCLDSNPASSINKYNKWLYNVPATGTFIKHPDATWSSGISGIPTGWTVKNMNPQVQSLDFNDVNAVYVKGNIGISGIYGQNNQLLWSKNTNI